MTNQEYEDHAVELIVEKIGRDAVQKVSAQLRRELPFDNHAIKTLCVQFIGKQLVQQEKLGRKIDKALLLEERHLSDSEQKQYDELDQKIDELN